MTVAPTPVALVLPAMGLRADYYRSFTTALAAAGFAAVVVDPARPGNRRAGPFARERPRLLRAGGNRRAQRREAPAGRPPGSPIVLVGHSLGGHVATLCAAAAPGSVAGLVTIAADSPYHRAHGARGPARLASAELAAAVARVVGCFPGGLRGFGGLGRQPRRLMAEWAHLGRTGRYRIDRLPQIEAAIAAVRLPVLAISVEGDRMAPPASIDHLAGKMLSAAVERWHYTAAAAGCARLTHANWAKFGSALAEQLAAWWESVAPAPPDESPMQPVVRHVVPRS